MRSNGEPREFDDTWEENKRNCACDSALECCPIGTLYPDSEEKRNPGDDWGSNPTHCECDSSKWCCPEDTPCTNRKHCKKSDKPEWETLCCEEWREDKYPENLNCPCDQSLLDVCCEAGTINLDGSIREFVDLYPANLNCPCPSELYCCDGDTCASNEFGHCDCDSRLCCCDE